MSLIFRTRAEALSHCKAGGWPLEAISIERVRAWTYPKPWYRKLTNAWRVSARPDKLHMLVQP